MTLLLYGEDRRFESATSHHLLLWLRYLCSNDLEDYTGGVGECTLYYDNVVVTKLE